MSELRYLAGVEVCQGLEAEQLAQVADCCRLVNVEDGKRIFKEGDIAEDLCFLIKGRVDLRFELPEKPSSGDMTILTIEPGSTFSWSALVPPHRYTLSSYAVGGPATYLQASEEALSDLFRREPRIGYIFMRNLNKVVGLRIRALQDELAKVSGQDLIDGW